MNDPSELLDFPGFRDWLSVVRTYNACERVLTHRLENLDLTLAQHDVLVALTAAGPMRQRDLADRLLVVKSNITAILTRMERDGLVTRSTDASDKRAKRVAPTAEGERRVTRSLAAQREVIAGMLSRLSADESALLGELMRRVRTPLDAELTAR